MTGQQQQQLKSERAHYQPRIFKLALIVILVPVVVSTISIAVLDNLWLATVANADNQRDQINLTIRSAWAGEDTIKYHIKMMQYMNTGDEEMKLEALKYRERAFRDWDNSIARSKDPQVQKFRDEAHYLVLGNLEDVQNKLAPKGTASGSDASFLVKSEKLALAAKHAFQAPARAISILEQQNSIISQLRVQERQLRSRLYYVVAAGMGISVLLALGLVMLYAVWVRKRLSPLVFNAANLQNPLAMRPVTGNDEFAYLNTVVEDVGEQLQTTAAQRQAVLQMVAHDIRSPLSAANLSLGLIEKSTNCSKQLRSNVAIARINLRGIVRFVNELLEAERQRQQEPSAMPSERASQATMAGSLAQLRSSGLFKKLLILVLVPVVLQVCCLTFLYNQMMAAQSFSLRQQEQIDLVRRQQNAAFRSVRLLAALMLYAATKNEGFDQVYLHDHQVILEALKQNIAATPFNAERDLYLELLKKFQASDYLHTGVKSNPGLIGLTSRFSEAENAANELAELNDRVRTIQNLTVEFLQQRATELKNLMTRVQTYIVVALSFNVLMGFVLVIAFSRGVQDRLGLLLRNVKSVNDRQFHTKAIGGNDELSLLDESIRAAKEQIIQAEQQRHFTIIRIADNIVSPLIVATSALEDIDEGDLAEQQAFEAKIAEALQAIARVRKLVDDLLYANGPAGAERKLNRQHHTLKQIIEESWQSVRSLADQKNVHLRDNCSDVTLNADKDRLIQVFTNLLSNAIKFTRENTNVEISSAQSNGQVSILVKDHGAGMDVSDTDRLFEKYFQADTGKQSEGFGLGLAIVKDIVDAHGGKIAIESAPGEGSTFIVSLPKE